MPALSDAVQLIQSGRLADAELLLRCAVELEPNNAALWNQLGIVLAMQDRYTESASAIQSAIEREPSAEAYSNLGNCLRLLGRLNEAKAALEQSLAMRADLAHAGCNLGIVYQELGQMPQAVAHLRKAVLLAPDFFEAHYSLGDALLRMGARDESLAEFRRTLELQPNHLGAQLRFGAAMQELGHLEESVKYCRSEIAAGRNSAQMHAALGAALYRQGRAAEGIAAVREALRLDPSFREPHSTMLVMLHAVPDVAPDDLFQEHLRWSRQHVTVSPRDWHPNAPDPKRKVRLGLVSPDLRAHAVAFFIEPLFVHHDRSRFEVVAYSTGPEDEVSRRLAGHASLWRQCAGLNEARLAELIAGDGIDILIDLAGHTAGNSLLAFARKPAPIQITYLGYPDTTGVTAIDYRITDALADPPGDADRRHVEKLMRLPRCAWCYRPPADAPEVAPAPARDRPVTFGSFNNLAKLTPEWIGVWSQILKRCPSSRLLLKAPALRDESTRRRIAGLFAENAIAAERLELSSIDHEHRAHLAAYGRIDIALDTFPYHGTTTTCEALWMGAGVITLAGAAHVSRVGLSLLTSAGLPDLVARSPDEYIAKAVDLAADPARRARLRTSLREQMRNSVLMDERSFVADFENALAAVWRNWCVNAHKRHESPAGEK